MENQYDEKPFDVHTGRGKSVEKRPGNKYYRKLVNSNKVRYKLIKCHIGKKDIPLERINDMKEKGRRCYNVSKTHYIPTSISENEVLKK
jgi:hypothetical protein